MTVSMNRNESGRPGTVRSPLHRNKDGGVAGRVLLYAGLLGLALVILVLAILCAGLQVPQLDRETMFWVALIVLAAVLAIMPCSSCCCGGRKACRS